MFGIKVRIGPWRRVIMAVIASAALAMPQGYAADAKPQAADAKQKSVAVKQKTYPTPEAAVGEFVAALKAGDAKALLEILGPDAKALIFTGDAVVDRQEYERFVKSYEEANKLEKLSDAKVVINTGKDAWPFAIPLVKDAAGWRFDGKQGQEEILNRRVGRNELSTMQALLAYVDAQREYYLRNPQGDKLLHYAQKFGSAQGKRDGLYWPAKAGEKPSPLGPLFDSARSAGYTKSAGAYLGYHYRILKAQGPDAPGGAYDYVAQGSMLGGHALVAWPATYGNSGVMTFLVNHDGVVYEKDLGPDTSALAAKITKFNPDKSWKKAEGK